MNEILRRFCALTLSRTGLALRESDMTSARDALQARCKALRMDGASYLRLLEEGSAATEREWRQLMPCLTNGESYFLRDAGQIELLRTHILPQLLASRSSHSATGTRASRTLRLWSAGCSTGEEPYSLAILLDGLLPQAIQSEWHIRILGTDINAQSIERARKGVYRPWSLRALEPALRTRYFQETSQGWQISARLQSMVTFEVGNLRADRFPRADGPHEMDVILCRNVLIYFERAAVSEVVHKFAATLKPGGYLLAGHAEIHPQDLGQLRPRIFTGSVVYERPTLPTDPSSGSAASRASATESFCVQGATRTSYMEPRPSVTVGPATARQTLFEEESVRSILRRSTPSSSSLTPSVPLERAFPTSIPAHNVAKLPLRQASASSASVTVVPLSSATPQLGASREIPSSPETLLHQAQAYADAGRYAAAVDICEKLIEEQVSWTAPYLLLARVAEERGARDQALSLLKKVIYLTPDCTLAYLELGDLYAGRSDIARARQMRQVALAQLEAEEDAFISSSVAQTTGSAAHSYGIARNERPALIAQLRKLLKAPDSPTVAR